MNMFQPENQTNDTDLEEVHNTERHLLYVPVLVHGII